MSNHDDFFGGSLAAPTPPPGGPNPLLTGNKEYASYGGHASSPARSSTPLVPLVVGVLVLTLAAVGGLLGYRALFGGTQIEFPQTLLGMDRIDDEAPLVRQVEQIAAAAEGDVDVQLGVYQSGEQALFVIAGAGGVSAADADEFFAGFDQGFDQAGGPGVLSPVHPGPRGGELRCLSLPRGATCTWFDGDTFGVYALTSPTSDAATTAHQIRDAIER